MEYSLVPWWVELMVKGMELTSESKMVHLMVVPMVHQKVHSRDLLMAYLMDCYLDS